MYPYLILVALGLCAAFLWILSYANGRKSTNPGYFVRDMKSAGMWLTILIPNYVRVAMIAKDFHQCQQHQGIPQTTSVYHT